MGRLEERIARALGHDLRSPLGTIVNCASLLDGDVAPDGAAVRDAAARIRRQAAGIADATQLLADALRIAAQPAERRRGEPLALLRALGEEARAGVALRLASPTPSAPTELALDARRVGFALRAFLAIERGARPQLPAEAELRIARDAGRDTIELGLDGALASAPEYGAPAAWADRGDGRVAPLAKLALEVAGDLLEGEGGSLEVAGAPGRRPALRLRLRSAPASPAAGADATRATNGANGSGANGGGVWPAIAARLGVYLKVLRTAVMSFNEVGPFQLAAALSYYMLLSLAPLVLVTVTVASMVVGRESVTKRLVDEVEKAAGPAAKQVVADVIAKTSPSASGVLLVVGIITVLIGATSVFVQLEDALNQIWRVPLRPDRSVVWRYLRGRVLSIAMVIGIGFLMLVSLLVSAALSALCNWLFGPSGTHWLAQSIDLVVSMAVITGLFAMILKVLPAVHVAWGDVWFGAIVTSLFFTAGKNLIALYLGQTGVGSAYGAAGSIVVMMVWVYYASLILLFGAQLTQARVGGRAAASAEAIPRPT